MSNNMQMNLYQGSFFSVILIWSFTLFSCADPTTLGSDLLQEDRIEAIFTDTVTIHSRTISGDSVVTFSPGPIWLTSYLFGDFKDPFFGKTYAEIYAQPTMQLSSFSFSPPNFANAQFDSVVLVLPYSGSGFYGNTEQLYGIEVYELADSLVRDSVYYSNTTLNVSELLGAKMFTPRLDSVTFIDYQNNRPDTISRAQLRVPLSEEFGQRLIQADTLTYNSLNNFVSFFKGFAVRPTVQTEGMISFDMVPSGDPQNAGIFVYYKRDSIPLQYRFPVSFSSPVVGHITNDRVGAPVEPFVDRPDFSDTLGYVQGTNGLLLELDFPNLEGLEDIIVNKAELVVSLSKGGNDHPDIFPAANQLFAFYYSPDFNDFRSIDDVLLPSPGTRDVVFGGLIETGSNGQADVYKMNISAFFQEMLKNDGERDLSDVIFITVNPRSERASRSILYGASHPEYPIKLNLTYTTQ